MGAESGAVLAIVVPKIVLVLAPSFFEGCTTQSSVVLDPIWRCNTGNINYLILLALAGGQWAVAWSTPAVAALGLLPSIVLLQQLGIVAAHCTAHIWHALVGYFHCVSIE